MTKTKEKEVAPLTAKELSDILPRLRATMDLFRAAGRAPDMISAIGASAIEKESPAAIGVASTPKVQPAVAAKKVAKRKSPRRSPAASAKFCENVFSEVKKFNTSGATYRDLAASLGERGLVGALDKLREKKKVKMVGERNSAVYVAIKNK